MKHHMLRQRRAGGDGVEAAAAAQRQLGGDVDGNRLLTVGPDGGELQITFNGPESFFVYDASGSKRAADAYIRSELGLPAEVEKSPAERIAKALAIWSETRPAAGTVIEKYLRRRAITIPVPEVLRYHPGPYHYESRSAPAPAMVAAVTDADGNQTGCHVTWLDPFGAAKARVSPARKTFGLIGGATVRLASVADEIAVGEGIETCLSFNEMTGIPAWAAMNAINLRALRLPASVRSVILLADNNTADDPGPSACRRAHQRLAAAGVRARIEFAPRGQDFNDVLIKEKTR